jgi:drug/metabolite transporter (DMT)-like permease
MNFLALGMALLGVTMVSLAQVLFKIAAPSFNDAGLPWADRFLTLALVGAVALYAAATLLWLVVLGRTRLSAVYPIMASSYILVPVLAWQLLSEPPSLRTGIGSIVIFAGICIAAS